MEQEINFEAFADEIFSKEDAKKEIADEIKEAIESFASSHNLEKDTVADALKALKKWRKDQSKFYRVDQEVAQILNAVIYRDVE